MKGFSLPVAMHGSAEERESLEQLCRCIASPALAYERMQCNAAGKMALKLKKPWHDASTHLVKSPLDFRQRPAAPVSRRRQLAPRLFARRPRERLFRSDLFDAVKVAEGVGSCRRLAQVECPLTAALPTPGPANHEVRN